ncbi:DUF4176 domain-containing protein [Paenibacillus taichungensis]|uniref:DUF4176 domain-containing protein n=1 Tax=Paenibacillus TaxID=44249 RepID=UPI00177F851B|nr:DUF4176 domain-containing protein [Paenibacillus sp. JNUCC-31]QOS81203.1 DUF4176 domain-containing protein [Paenibacillus sp. JNUCC-31]
MEKETSTLLPNGSVILLKEGTKKLVIYGRKQMLMTEPPRQFDYIGCLYPEGYINADYTYVFNHEDIEEIIFRGYADEEEEAFAVSLSES